MRVCIAECICCSAFGGIRHVDYLRVCFSDLPQRNDVNKGIAEVANICTSREKCYSTHITMRFWDYRPHRENDVQKSSLKF